MWGRPPRPSSDGGAEQPHQRSSRYLSPPLLPGITFPRSRERAKNFAAASIRPTALEARATPESAADACSTHRWESPISEAFRKRPQASRYGSYFASDPNPVVHSEIDFNPRISFSGNDVPRIFQNHIRSHKIERPRRIRLMTAAHRANITVVTLQLRDRALDLHCHKLPRTPHHAVVTRRVSPRLARRQPLLARPHQKHRLRPLPPLLLVLNNLRLPPLHSRQVSSSQPRPLFVQKKGPRSTNSPMPPNPSIRQE